MKKHKNFGNDRKFQRKKKTEREEGQQKNFSAELTKWLGQEKAFEFTRKANRDHTRWLAGHIRHEYYFG